MRWDDGAYDLNQKFNDIELYPGKNTFWAHGIGMKNCPPLLSQYVEAKKTYVRLYLPTKTDCFDYSGFTKKDSLSGYIEKWNYSKWGIPYGVIKWKFVPDKQGEKQLPETILNSKALYKYHTNNHFKYNLYGFWDLVSSNIEGYNIVKKGTVNYMAGTFYNMYDYVHTEWDNSWSKFTTDIIDGFAENRINSNGTHELKGMFRTSQICSLCTGIKFSANMFDGC